jgi:hypothetical protein
LVRLVVVKDDPILIAGGGLGGVAAALARERKGLYSLGDGRLARTGVSVKS